MRNFGHLPGRPRTHRRQPGPWSWLEAGRNAAVVEGDRLGRRGQPGRRRRRVARHRRRLRPPASRRRLRRRDSPQWKSARPLARPSRPLSSFFRNSAEPSSSSASRRTKNISGPDRGPRAEDPPGCDFISAGYDTIIANSSRAVNRIIIAAKAFGTCGLVLHDDALVATSRKLIAHALTLRDKGEVFIENGGRDSSYNVVSIFFGQVLALHSRCRSLKPPCPPPWRGSSPASVTPARST